MKLYTSIGPNPRVVKMFAAEKGISLDHVVVDIIAGENRQPAWQAINPTCTTPVLELEGGLRIAETTAICEYLEEFRPAPALDVQPAHDDLACVERMRSSSRSILAARRARISSSTSASLGRRR